MAASKSVAVYWRGN